MISDDILAQQNDNVKHYIKKCNVFPILLIYLFWHPSIIWVCCITILYCNKLVTELFMNNHLIGSHAIQDYKCWIISLMFVLPVIHWQELSRHQTQHSQCASYSIRGKEDVCKFKNFLVMVEISKIMTVSLYPPVSSVEPVLFIFVWKPVCSLLFAHLLLYILCLQSSSFAAFRMLLLQRLVFCALLTFCFYRTAYLFWPLPGSTSVCLVFFWW